MTNENPTKSCNEPDYNWKVDMPDTIFANEHTFWFHKEKPTVDLGRDAVRTEYIRSDIVAELRSKNDELSSLLRDAKSIISYWHTRGHATIPSQDFLAKILGVK